MCTKIITVLNNFSEKAAFEEVFSGKNIQSSYSLLSLDTLIKLLDEEFDAVILPVQKNLKLSFCIFMVLRRVRPHITCIGLFGDVQKSDIAKFRETGMQYTLSLPLVPALLSELIDLVIHQVESTGVKKSNYLSTHPGVHA